MVLILISLFMVNMRFKVNCQIFYLELFNNFDKKRKTNKKVSCHRVASLLKNDDFVPFSCSLFFSFYYSTLPYYLSFLIFSISTPPHTSTPNIVELQKKLILAKMHQFRLLLLLAQWNNYGSFSRSAVKLKKKKPVKCSKGGGSNELNCQYY